jgi:O-acetyl-ADP-ribose deacetylase (regulator of RNase III)
MKDRKFLGGKVVVKVGDITAETVGAIVNAANPSLLGGGGVDGAIHRKGGPGILQECREIRRGQYPNGLPTGKAVLTTGGDLPAGHVIHTVGPVYGRAGGKEAELLGSCYRSSLLLAEEKGLRTVAFPAISTGVYGYPPEEAAQVASQALRDFLSADSTIREVRLVFFTLKDAETFLAHQQLEAHAR